MYRIDVHARLLILRKKSPLYGLISVCTFIYFEKKFPPARLFHPACLLVLVCSKFHSTHDPEQSIPQHYQSNPKAILRYSKVSQSIHTNSNKRAGWNRRAGGNFFSKSINVQTKIRPCRGDFFPKINKRACTSIRYTRVLTLNFTLSLAIEIYTKGLN